MTKKRAITPRLLRTAEAAEYLGISGWKLRRIVQRGELAYIQDNDGGPWLLDLRDLDAYIERHKISADPLENPTTKEF